jgi:hypothetical protein
MGKQTEVRAQGALSVRVLGMDANGRPMLETAQTVNISRHGVVIGGLRSRVNPGEVVSLQYKGRKVRYRVVWAGQGETAGQLGLEQINLQDDLWQQDAPLDTGGDTGFDTREPGAERRQQRRFETSLPVEVRSPQGAPIRAEISDVSLNGCYVNTLFPVPLDSVVTIVFWLGDDKLVVKGQARTSVLGVGCGIEFIDLSAEVSKGLAEYLQNTCQPATDRRKNAAGEPATHAEATAAHSSLSRTTH